MSATHHSSARQKLHWLADQLRIRLMLRRLPTDLEYVWIRFEGEEWQPDLADPEAIPIDPSIRYELRSWHEQLVAQTEPSSEDRKIGDLLNEVRTVLTRYASEFALENIVAGMIRKASLEAGPRERKRAKDQKREIVQKCADEYWQRNQFMRGYRSATADAIAEKVNLDLLASGHSKLAKKTIADYLAEKISG